MSQRSGVELPRKVFASVSPRKSTTFTVAPPTSERHRHAQGTSSRCAVGITAVATRGGCAPGEAVHHREDDQDEGQDEVAGARDLRQEEDLSRTEDARRPNQGDKGRAALRPSPCA